MKGKNENLKIKTDLTPGDFSRSSKLMQFEKNRGYLAKGIENQIILHYNSKWNGS